MALTVVAVVVFAFAGYVLVHDEAVHRAGRIPRQPAAATIRTPGPSTSSTSSAPTGPPTITAFIGDDWTSGVGASDKSKRFTSLVSAALNLDERNFGSAGSGYARQGTSGGGDYTSQLPDVVLARPAFVVVSGGRNDVNESVTLVASRARRLFQQLRTKLPNATVVAIRPMWGDSPPTKALLKVAQVVRIAAKSAGVPFLGVHDPILDHPGFMTDDADPNDRGYAAIAAALEKRLPQYLPN